MVYIPHYSVTYHTTINTRVFSNVCVGVTLVVTLLLYYNRYRHKRIGTCIAYIGRIPLNHNSL